MKGLLCFIYENKSFGNCSNGGISSKVKSVILTGKRIAQIFEPDDDKPEVRLEHRLVCGRPYLTAYPVEPIKKGNIGYMCGGCFIYTSDGRFPASYPIPLHDRQETLEQNERLSR